jgi:hypothetical protein
MLKTSLTGGITYVARSFAGRDLDPDPYVGLAEEQLRGGGEGGGPDLELRARLDRSRQSIRDYLRGCNSHLLEGGGHPADKVVYTDLNSQYCCSGNFLFLLLHF